MWQTPAVVNQLYQGCGAARCVYHGDSVPRKITQIVAAASQMRCLCSRTIGWLHPALAVAWPLPQAQSLVLDTEFVVAGKDREDERCEARAGKGTPIIRPKYLYSETGTIDQSKTRSQTTGD